jgi:hypothetical protein
MVEAGLGEALAYGAKQFTDLQMKYVRGILDEVGGSRELAVELYNASRYDLELIDQLVVHGKTTQGVSRTTVEPGETVSWKACKGAWALFGTQVYTAFKVKGTDRFIFLGNECPLAGAAKAWSSTYKDDQMEGGLEAFHSTHEALAHANHQKSGNGYLQGTVNCFSDTDGVVFRYVYQPK